MASILKTFAIAAGAGVAIGLCTTAGGRRAPRPRLVSRPVEPREPLIDIEPLLDRLETIERRFESAAVPKPAPVEVSALTRRIDAQEAEIERLRELVDVRSAEIQSRLEAEMDVRHRRSMESIEFKVSERIAALERTLGEQSDSIDALRTRAHDTDANLQRLIVAIERLCERTQPAAPVTAPVVIPFETHLSEARKEDEQILVGSRNRVFSEPEAEPEPKKSRFPLARIFGMIAVFVLTQALTY